MTDNTKNKIKRAVITAAIGVLLALACSALPDDYRGPCEILVNLCTGGF